MEFVANYVRNEKRSGQSWKGSNRVQKKKPKKRGPYPRYQVYDARSAINSERDEFFRSGKAQVADHSMGKMGVRFGGLGR
jgi:hypothetical protein